MFHIFFLGLHVVFLVPHLTICLCLVLLLQNVNSVFLFKEFLVMVCYGQVLDIIMSLEWWQDYFSYAFLPNCNYKH